MAVRFRFLSLTSLALWESSSTTQGPAGCAGAVTPVSLGRDALGRCPLIRALCPPHAWGSGPFLFMVGVVRSVFSVVSSSKVCWPRTTDSGRSGGIPLFTGNCARQLMVQALFLHLCILGKNSLYLSWQHPAALGTATSVPSCLSGPSTQLRT